MDAPRSRAASPACPVEATVIPGCDTGPGGRLAFVVRELVRALRQRRSNTAKENR